MIAPRLRRALDLALRAAIVVGASVEGLALRLSHAHTFAPAGRQSDFENTLRAIDAMATCRCVLSAGDELHNAYHGPLFYGLAARVAPHGAGESVERIAWISVAAWAARQVALCVGVRALLPEARWALVLAAVLHAALPVSVYQDGIAYNESLHATLFTVALFALWRVELRGPRQLSPVDAVVFGVFSALGLLTKTTSVLLPLAAVALVAVWLRRDPRPVEVLRRVALPACAAAVSWLLVAGWWLARNLVAYRHPFPHQYDVRAPAVIAVYAGVGDAWTEQRRLGWYLPFEPRVWRSPFAPWPRQNFWSEMLAGTWADDINHGFCRLSQEHWSTGLTGGAMTDRCIEVGTALTRVGLGVTVVSALGVALWAWRAWRRDGRFGSVVVPFVTASSLALLMVFGSRYPFDNHPVIKASYALYLAPPLCVAFGVVVAGDGRESSSRARAWRAVAVTAALAVLGFIGWQVRREVRGDAVEATAAAVRSR